MPRKSFFSFLSFLFFFPPTASEYIPQPAPKARIIPLDHQATMDQAPILAVAPSRWDILVTMDIHYCQK